MLVLFLLVSGQLCSALLHATCLATLIGKTLTLNTAPGLLCPALLLLDCMYTKAGTVSPDFLKSSGKNCENPPIPCSEDIKIACPNRFRSHVSILGVGFALLLVSHYSKEKKGIRSQFGCPVFIRNNRQSSLRKLIMRLCLARQNTINRRPNNLLILNIRPRIRKKGSPYLGPHQRTRLQRQKMGFAIGVGGGRP